MNSRNRLILNLVFMTMITYTMVGNFPQENKILAVAFIPLGVLHFLNWLKQSNKEVNSEKN